MPGARHPVVVLWATPRTASTAFERMIIERGDHTVLDEPFSRHYYFGPLKRSARFDEVLPDSHPDEIVATIEAAARARPVFVKDMAYHAAGALSPDVMTGWVHTFLVRHPARALPSLARRWPDFTFDEAGYEALEALVTEVERPGHVPPVIDSDDLCRQPHAIVEAWCGRVGMPFLRESLTWEAGMRPEWELWADWYEETVRSTGFVSPSGEPPPPIEDPRLALGVDRCLPIYERLRARRLRP